MQHAISACGSATEGTHAIDLLLRVADVNVVQGSCVCKGQAAPALSEWASAIALVFCAMAPHQGSAATANTSEPEWTPEHAISACETASTSAVARAMTGGPIKAGKGRGQPMVAHPADTVSEEASASTPASDLLLPQAAGDVSVTAGRQCDVAQQKRVNRQALKTLEGQCAAIKAEIDYLSGFARKYRYMIGPNSPVVAALQTDIGHHTRVLNILMRRRAMASDTMD